MNKQIIEDTMSITDLAFDQLKGIYQNDQTSCCVGARLAGYFKIKSGHYLEGIDEFAGRLSGNRAHIVLMLRQAEAGLNPLSSKDWDNHPKKVWQKLLEIEELPSLKNADLQNTNFSDADLSRSDFSGADLRNANLKNTDLSNTNLSDSDFRFSNFKGANLQNANLSDANLSGVHLICTDLRNANLKNTDLSNSVLTGADLRGANLKNVILKSTDFKNAKLDEGVSIEDTNYNIYN